MKILIVEDDRVLARAIADALVKEHFLVDVAADGQAGGAYIEKTDYDAVLLNTHLPKLDGISLCQQLRARHYQMPILLIAASDRTADKVKGLNVGADDYIVKPFSVEELIARLRALWRRSSATALSLSSTFQSPALVWGDLQIDCNRCEVTYRGQLIHLTPKEYHLIELFLRNPRRIFSRSAILDRLWSLEEIPTEETVRSHIKGLRMKLKASGAPDLIETVYGLGYRCQPLEVAVAGPASKVNNHRAQNYQQTLTQIWQRSQESILERITILEQVAATYQRTGKLTSKMRQKAEQQAHKLAGSLGTFGFTEGSRIAKEIEQIFQHWSEIADFGSRLGELTTVLRLELEQPVEKLPKSLPSRDRPLVLIMDSDRQFAQQLALEAIAWGLRAKITSHLAEAQTAIAAERPDAVLLDLSFADPADTGFNLLAELSSQTPPIPVLVLAAGDSFVDRVTAARLGGRAFLQKPLSTSQAIDAVTRVLNQISHAEYKILAVDDDPLVLAALKHLLEPWGLRVVTLDCPQKFWETLATTVPDLLILDVEMPDFSGIELCQVVRNDPRWSQLPILFLTCHTDAEMVRQVFAAGADDYTSKPIVEPELVTRILNRLERVQLWRSLAEIDALTGVANRRRFTQDIQQFLHLAERQQQPFTVALLDFDRFKQINDSWGHAAGDRVLQRFGKLLQQFFRAEDSVARWGGEEFLVGMYGMTKIDGTKRLSELLATMRQEEFTSDSGQKFHVTLSAGIAQYPEDGQDLQALYLAADVAMYQAKAAGRDRIHLAQSAPLTVENGLPTPDHLSSYQSAESVQLPLADILESSGDAIIRSDLDGIILSWNPGAEKIYGYSAAEVRGKSLSILIPVHHQDELARILATVKQGGRLDNYETIRIRKDGEPIEVSLTMSPLADASGNITGQITIARNISDRKRIEEMLKRLWHQNELILNSVGEGICGLDLQGQIRFINPAAARMLGYEATASIPQGMNLIWPQCRPLADGTLPASPKCLIDLSLTRGESHQEIAGNFPRRDGTSFPVEYAIAPIREAGAIVGAVLTFRDVTERQAIEQMKSEFVSIVSHELRTPLTSIRGALGMLASGLLKAHPAKAERMLEIAATNTDRLVRLINDILDIERIESGKVSMERTVCDASHLMLQAVEVMQPMAEKAGVTLVVEPFAANLFVDGDRILQTLTNLLSNAIKFSPPETTVWLSASQQFDDILFQVKDRGRGIPADKLESVFERFQQVDASDSRQKGGTGLGLAICRSIVQHHGGRIWAESVFGSGSSFFLSLPIFKTDKDWE